MDKLHQEIVVAVADLRRRLADANVGSHFRLDIEVSGRIEGGDVLVAYVLGETYGAANARGARLTPVIDEFLRRKGWNEAHAPLALEAPQPCYEEPIAEHQEAAE
jgi:hypothetical protein